VPVEPEGEKGGCGIDRNHKENSNDASGGRLSVVAWTRSRGDLRTVFARRVSCSGEHASTSDTAIGEWRLTRMQQQLSNRVGGRSSFQLSAILTIRLLCISIGTLNWVENRTRDVLRKSSSVLLHVPFSVRETMVAVAVAAHARADGATGNPFLRTLLRSPPEFCFPLLCFLQIDR